MPLTSPTTDRGDKREAILDAALELFAERGFHGTAVPLVAERAKVGAGTIYRYFESKEALVNALYQLWKGKLAAAVMSDFPFDAPVRRQFHVFWRRMAEFVRSYPRAFSFMQLHHSAPCLDPQSRQIESALVMQAATFLEHTTRQQVTKDLPPNLLIAIVLGAFVGIFQGSCDGHLVMTDEVLDQAEACVWEAIRR